MKKEKTAKKEKEIPKKKTRKVLKVVGLILGILLLVGGAILGTGYFMYNKKKEQSDAEIAKLTKVLETATKEYKEEIEYGTSWEYNDFLTNLVKQDKLEKDTKIVIMVDKEEIKKDESYKFLKAGDIKIEIKVEDTYNYKILKEHTEVIKKDKTLTLKVMDTKMPVIEGVSDKTITVGDTIDLKNGITAKDEVDGDLEIIIEGEVDNKKAGTYTIKVKATDKNGNEAEAEFKVTVKEKTVTKPSTSTKPSTGNTGSSGNSGSASTNPNCTRSALSAKGYSSSDKDACKKDQESRVIAQQIANQVKAKGYSTDLEKVQEAASIVSSYYYRGVHVESGLDYRTPYGVFIKGEASCAGTTRALALVLEYLGYKTEHVNANQWTHQWLRLTMDGQVGFADGQIGLVGYGKHPVEE